LKTPHERFKKVIRTADMSSKPHDLVVVGLEKMDVGYDTTLADRTPSSSPDEAKEIKIKRKVKK
jgi:hypothetical protein